jgi:guanylate kinase
MLKYSITSMGPVGGTSGSALEAGRDLLLEIDWQGAAQVRARLPEAIDVFILPPSRRSARTAPQGSGVRDTEEVIQRRLKDSVTELSRWHEFRCNVVVNEHFDRALADLQHIVAGDAAGYRSDRPELGAFAASLVG